MKSLKTILGIALSVGGLGTAATVTGVSIAQADRAVIDSVVEAANTGSKGDVIYFTPSDHWAEANATFKLQWYKNNNYIGSSFMNEITGNHLSTSRTSYYATVGDAFDAVQILRFNPEKTTQWNYSNNSSVSGENRWLVMTKTCNWNDTWKAGDSSGTYWSSVDCAKLGSDQTASSSTTRVFVNNQNSHFDPVGIRAWGGDASQTIGGAKSDATIYHLNWFEDINSVWYGYAEIPTNVTGFKIIKLSEDTYDGIPSYYQNGDEITPASLSNRIIYCPENGNDISFGGAKDNAAGPSLMSKLLEAIDTCSSSSINGYGAYSNLNNYYYSHATAEAKATNCASLGGNNYTVQEHFEGMARRPASLPGSNVTEIVTKNNSSTIIALMSISLVVLSGVGLFLFIRKKKHN